MNSANTKSTAMLKESQSAIPKSQEQDHRNKNIIRKVMTSRHNIRHQRNMSKNSQEYIKILDSLQTSQLRIEDLNKSKDKFRVKNSTMDLSIYEMFKKTTARYLKKDIKKCNEYDQKPLSNLNIKQEQIMNRFKGDRNNNKIQN